MGEKPMNVQVMSSMTTFNSCFDCLAWVHTERMENAVHIEKNPESLTQSLLDAWSQFELKAPTARIKRKEKNTVILMFEDLLKSSKIGCISYLTSVDFSV
jgi:hypothetical protein